MAKAWMDDIRKSKKLLIYPQKDFLSAPAWGADFFSDTIDLFNGLLAKKKIDFRYEATAVAPPKDGPEGTSVQIGVSTGTHTYFQFGKNTGKLPPGSSLNAKTHIDRYGKGNLSDAKVAKASIFVNVTPTITEEQRMPGSGVKRYVMMHEMLHAMGLEDDDPGHKSAVANPDFFATFTSTSPGDEAEAKDGRPGDRIQLGPEVFMPEFFLSTGTIRLINSIWK